MTGFNLPPGCSVSDLPGNSKAEMKAEAMCDSFYDLLAECGYETDDPRADALVEKLYDLATKIENEAFKEGEAEVRMWNKVIPFTPDELR